MTLSYIPSDTNDEGILKATASGSLPNGKAVIVNADGTVSVVAETSRSQALGSEAVFESASTYYTSSTFDSNSNRVVTIYNDFGNSDYLVCVVGTVSGTSISYGTPVIISSTATINNTIVFDSSNNKVVAVYRDKGPAPDRGTAIVGTVDPSDNSISFGTAVTFGSAISAYPVATFDSNANKVVILFADGGNSYYGSGVVGTVSGTGISFGSISVFLATGNAQNIVATFDSNLNKVVVSYTDAGSSSGVRSLVGTVSGTSISFASPTTITTQLSNSLASTFDSVNNKVLLIYRDDLNDAYQGYARVGAVSGTSISFGDATALSSGKITTHYSPVFDAGIGKIVVAYNNNTDTSGEVVSASISSSTISFDTALVFSTDSATQTSAVFDTVANNVAIAFSDAGNSGYGTSVVFQPAYSSTNLTAENYIGISTGGTYASGSNATIKIIGNTSNEQSSLTAGQSYYVQTDGTLGTTAADPSVFAGTAISATKLLVKT